MKRFLKFAFLSLIILSFATPAAYTGMIMVYPKFKYYYDGSPCSGCKVYTYENGTVTEAESYSDADCSTPNANPVVLDSEGEATIFGNRSYTFKIYTSADALIDTINDVEGIYISTNEKRVSQYDDFADALTQIGAVNDTLLIVDEDYAMTASKTVTANITLKFIPGCMITTTGYTLTVSAGPNNIIAQPNQQIFAGSGTVTFTLPGTVYPDWWVENATPGTTDMINAFTRALTSLNTAGGTIRLLGQIYAITTTIDMSSMTEHQVRIIGETRYKSQVKWTGGNTDSMIKLKDYTILENLIFYNGNSSTSLIGFDAVDTVGNTIWLTFRNVRARLCAVGFGFRYSWYNTLQDCLADYCDIGYDLRTEANNINFFNSHADNCGIGIDSTNGTGSREVMWSGGSIENSTTLGIKTSASTSYAWVFDNIYLEDNYQHQLSSVSIRDAFVNHDGGTGTRPPFSIVGGNVYLSILEASADITNMFTNTATGYETVYVKANGEEESTAVATSVVTEASDLDAGVFDNSMFKIYETPWLDASAAHTYTIIQQNEKFRGRPDIVRIYIVVDTQIVVSGNFVVTVGRNASDWDNIVNQTFSANIDPGATALTMASSPYNMVVSDYSHKITTTAETSGQFKIVVVTVP